MSATIVRFPILPWRAPAQTGSLVAAGAGTSAPAISASELARKFEDHFLPLVQASVDLLAADEKEFEARCRRMLDADGTAMIDELCEEMRIVGEQMQVLVDGLELTRGRLRTAMGRLIPRADRFEAAPD